MKKIHLDETLFYKKRELTKEEKEIKEKQLEYCKQFAPEDTTISYIIQNDNEQFPSSFKYLKEGEPDLGYISGTYVQTPYGIKLDILEDMKRNGLYELSQTMKYSFDTYEDKQSWQKIAKEKSLNYVKNFDKEWFTITGISGCGKSHLATSIVFGLASKCINVKYLSWVDFLSELKADFDTSGQKIDYIKKREVLYIDDFLKSGVDGMKPRDYDLEVARNIIWYRYDKNLPTILSSEYDTEKEMYLINKALAGRIIEKSKDNVVNIGNEEARNYRLHGK